MLSTLDPAVRIQQQLVTNKKGKDSISERVPNSAKQRLQFHLLEHLIQFIQ